MTAIFTGPGAGLARGSATTLGSSGLLGSGSTGRAGENIAVNAATGNLVISRQDEFITGLGADYGVSRTYNSLAEVHDGDNNDRWQMSTTRRVFGLSGTVNAVGSSVRRQAGDGSVITYHWGDRGGVAAYWATDGDGAHDKIEWLPSTEWRWTDGDTQATEYYEATSNGTGNRKIVRQYDAALVGISYSYNGSGLLEQVTQANGEYIRYIYSGSQITRIDTGLADRTVTRTSYGYDGNGRLSTVSVDLIPDSVGEWYARNYTISYEYGGNGLISAVAQTDGSRTEIAYDTAGRVISLTEHATASETRVTSFAYGPSYTDVTAPNGQTTRLEYAGGNIAGGAIGAWGDGGVTKELAGSIGGEPAMKYTSAPGAEWSGISAGLNASAGQSYKLTVSLMAVAGHATDQYFGLYGNSSGWGDTRYSSARIISGPGQIQQWQSAYGALWYVTGLSSTEATKIEIVRTYTYAESGGAYIYVDHPNGVRDGQQLIIAGPSLDPLSDTPVYAAAAMDWPISGLDRQSGGTVGGAPGALLTSSVGATWSGASVGLNARTGDTFKLKINLQAVAGSATDQILGLYGNTTGWGDDRHTHAQIVSGPGTLIRYAAGLWRISGLSTSQATQIEIVRTYDRDESGGAYIYVDHLGGVRDGQQLLISAPTVSRFTDYAANDRQLTRIIAPPAYSGAAQQIQTFEYDSDGNLIKSTAPNGAITNYQYDAKGNVTLIDNPVGADVTRTYGAKNRVVLETSHGSAENGSLVAHHTSYAYNNAGLLRFRVSPDGKVTEYSYDDYGRIAITTEYTGQRYDWGPSTDEASMISWRNSLADKTKNHISQNVYDARGNVYLTYDYAAADAAGNASTTYGYTATYYTYDHLGRLLSTNQYGDGQETYLYDGLNRVIGSSDAAGAVTTVFFDDAGTAPGANGQTRTVMHLASGLNRILTYNKAGDLISEVESAAGATTNNLIPDQANWGLFNSTSSASSPIAGYPATRYAVSTAGQGGIYSYLTAVDAGETVRWRFTLKGDGTTSMHEFGIYATSEGWGTNSQDMQAAIVSGPGRLSQIGGAIWQLAGASTSQETVIELVRTFGAAQTAAPHFYIGGTNGAAAGVGVILSAISVTRTVSDANLAISATTSNAYDKLGRLRVSYDQFDGNNHTYFVYDNAGRKTAEVNDYRYLTEFVYDANNRVIATIKHANGIDPGYIATLQDPNNTLTIAQLRPGDHTYDLYQWTIYDVGGRVAQSIDGSGVVTAYEYDGQNRVVRTTVYGNRISTAGFTSSPPTSPVAVSANAAIDSVTRSFYDRDGYLRGTLDGEGYLVEYVYDAAGRKIAETRFAQAVPAELRAAYSFSDIRANAAPGSASNRTTRFVYDARGLLVAEIDAQNQATVFAYAPHSTRVVSTRIYNNPISVSSYSLEAVSAALVGHSYDRITYLTFDKAGRVTVSQDAAGTATYYTYDSAGNVTKVRHGSNAATEQITRNWYDARGNKRFSVDPAGYLTKYIYTAGGRLSAEYRYDTAVSVGDATTIGEVAALAAGAYTGMTYVYDILGQLSYKYDDTGSITSYNYYATGFLGEVHEGFGSGWATQDKTMSVLVYDNAGRLKYEYSGYGESEGIYRYSGYDALGNRIQHNDGRGIASYATYDRRGLLKSETDAAGGVTTYTRNAFGEITHVVDARGNLTTIHYYDTLGRRVQTDDYAAATIYAYNRFGELASTTRAGATTYFYYDKMGRVTQITDALGYADYFAYNEVGDRISATNKLGGTTSYAYDRRGLKTAETLPMTSVNSAGAVQAWTVTNTYAYDSRGNLVTETKAAGLAEQTVTSHEYDRANRLIHTVGATFHGVTPHTYYAYDARGNLTKKTDPNGNRTVYYYDDLGRVTVEINAAGTYTGYLYDGNGNVTDIRVYATAVGVPADGGSQEEAPAPSGDFRQTTFTYDGANRMLTSAVHGAYTGTYDGANWTGSWDSLNTQYQYDANGNLVKTIDPNGNATWAYYDVMNRKWSQVDAAGYRTDWSYDGNGNVTRERRYWNPMGSPTSTSYPPGAGGGDDYLDRITDYTYDLMGNRKSEIRLNVKVHDGAGGHYYAHSAIYYNYNGLGQVAAKAEATGDAINYTYDSAGRLTQESKSSFYDYYNGGTVTPTTQYSYDGLGQLTRQRQVGAGDAADRVTTYGYSGGKLQWVRDAAANHGSDADGKQTNYWYDAAGNLQYEYYTRYTSTGAAASGSSYDGIYRVYDGLGRVTQQWNLNYPGGWVQVGPTTTTTYNAYGEVASVQVGGGGLQQNQYDKAGRLAGSNAGDGAWKYFAYDKSGNQTAALTSAGANLAGSSFAAAYGGAGTVLTFTRYDSRNLAVSVHEPGRELTVSSSQTLVSQRAYNAFGELYYEFAANGGRIDYTYNNMGRLIRVESPNVDVVGENGAVSYGVRPTEHFYYDLGGRLVGKRDANGNLTRYDLLANTGYGGSQSLIRDEHHADGGKKSTAYDVFGDARILYDEMNRATYQFFDQMGRATRVYNVATGLDDYFGYDGLGQRLWHYNNHYGSGNTETTDYDILGRVVSQRSFGGDTTTTSYTFYASIGGFGGWQEIETFANGLTRVQNIDIFGRLYNKIDLGGHAFDYYYDGGGRMYQLVHQNVGIQTYQYFNTGKLKQIAMPYTGQGSAPTTTYGYDVMGNLTSQSTYDALYGTTQSLTASYDALGRMISWSEAGNPTTPAASSTITYDANGNIRSKISTVYSLDANGAASTQYSVANWFRYDGMNRVVLNNGHLENGVIKRRPNATASAYWYGTVFAPQSETITYNAAGQRTSAAVTEMLYDDYGVPVAAREQKELYYYDGAGRLTQTNLATGTQVAASFATQYDLPPAATGSGVLRSLYGYDLMNRQVSQNDYNEAGTAAVFNTTTTYNAKGQVSNTYAYTLRSDNSTRTQSTTNYFTDYNTGQYMLGAIGWSSTTGTAASTTKNWHQWWDGAVQSGSTATSGSTTYSLNAFGQLYSAYIADGKPRTVTYKLDELGQVIRRDESNVSGQTGAPHEVWYRMGGREMGYVGNNSTTDVSMNSSIAQRRAVAPASPGTFRFGYTYGAPAAEFTRGIDKINSYSQGSRAGSYTAAAGDTLQSLAQRLYGDATLWYKIAEVNGLSGGGRLTEGQQLTLPGGVVRSTYNAGTVKPYDPAEAVGDLSPNTPKPAKKAKCGAFGQILLAVVAVAVTVIAPFGGGVVAGIANSVLGSVVSQAVGVATGIQEKFSFKGVALAALSAGVGAGVGQALGTGAMAGSKLLGDAVRGAVGSAVTQGVAVATGLQDKFSWAGVAAAGIGAGIGGAVTRGLGSQGGLFGIKSGSAFVTNAASISASAIANAATRSAISGESFGKNLIAAIPDVIGQVVGGAIGSTIKQAAVRRVLRQAIFAALDPKYPESYRAQVAAEAARGLNGSSVTFGAIAGPGQYDQDNNRIVLNEGLAGFASVDSNFGGVLGFAYLEEVGHWADRRLQQLSSGSYSNPGGDEGARFALAAAAALTGGSFGSFSMGIPLSGGGMFSFSAQSTAMKMAAAAAIGSGRIENEGFVGNNPAWGPTLHWGGTFLASMGVLGGNEGSGAAGRVALSNGLGVLSQVADMFSSYDAKSLFTGKYGILASEGGGLIWTSQDEAYMRTMYDGLHALPATRAEATKEWLNNARQETADYIVARMGQRDFLRAGIALHRFGDLYAHVDEGGNPYWGDHGHLGDGHYPDMIFISSGRGGTFQYRPQKVMGYIDALSGVLSRGYSAAGLLPRGVSVDAARAAGSRYFAQYYNDRGNWGDSKFLRAIYEGHPSLNASSLNAIQNTSSGSWTARDNVIYDVARALSGR